MNADLDLLSKEIVKLAVEDILHLGLTETDVPQRELTSLQH